MSFRYLLPNEVNEATEHTTETNSIIMIGSNGSGKSRLGAWIEQQSPNDVHRIGGQRSLTFGSFIQQKSYEQATNLLLCGNETLGDSHLSRWGYEEGKIDYTSSLLTDYEHVLSALIALKSKQQEEYIDTCKKRDQHGLAHDTVPAMVTDVFKEIWEGVFPQRNISFNDGKVTAIYINDQEISEYRGRDMSDGERVALYLIAQALCVPEGKTVIIDEPEIHLHRSIMNKLWSAIEEKRKDCLFIYITHDTHFAAHHAQSQKLWVKNYDGETWEIERVAESGLPEQLLLDILGNRKPVLFVEGTMDSYDTKLYTKIYTECYVVPCGGCGAVIDRTKAMRETPQLHHIQCYGIIDKDYRSQYEINKLKDRGVYTLTVSEVENIFIVEELLIIVNDIMAHSDRGAVDKAIDYVVNDRYSQQINRQICEAVVAEIKYLLSSGDISKESEEDAKQSLDNLFAGINYDEMKTLKEKVYIEALETRSYPEILSLFNCKQLSTSVGHFFGMQNDDYIDLIFRHVNGERGEEIISALMKYMPVDIPH